MDAPTLILRISNGYIYLSADVYGKFFNGFQNVALLPGKKFGQVGQDVLAYLFPIGDSASGGLLVKIRNSFGDRAISATEFLRAAGFDDFQEFDCDAYWDFERQALAIRYPSV